MEENKNELQQETEVVKAVREEMNAQLEALKQNYENTINTMRAEHIQQVRDILRSGSAAAPMNSAIDNDEDDIDDDGISKKAVAAQIDRINKQLKR